MKLCNKLNKFDASLSKNDFESAEKKSNMIETSITVYILETKQSKNVILHLFGSLLLDFFVFDELSSYFEREVELTFKKITEYSKSDFSSTIFKICAFLESRKKIFLATEILLQVFKFYVQSNLIEKAFFMADFFINFCKKNDFKNDKLEEFQIWHEKILNSQNIDSFYLIEISKLVVFKYQYILKMTDLFTDLLKTHNKEVEWIEHLFRNWHKLPKNYPKSKIHFLLLEKYNNFGFLINFDENMSNLLNKLKIKPYFRRLKIISNEIGKMSIFNCSFFVLKFNYLSNGFKFRQLIINQRFIALISSNKTVKTELKKSNKGVCELKRHDRRNKRCNSSKLFSKIFKT